MAHAIQLPSSAHDSIDAGRIAANTGTLLINGALLLLLLVPLSQRVLDAPASRDDAITIVQLPSFKPVEPPPQNVQITQQPPQPVTRSTPQRQPVVAQVEQQIVDAQPGDIAVETADVVADEGAATIEPATTSIAQLQALRAPPPPYPAEAMRAGLSGTVELEILVGTDGRALDVRVVKSSGHRVLDQTARRTVLSKWTFVPAMRDGRAVEALGRLPIEFVL